MKENASVPSSSFSPGGASGNDSESATSCSGPIRIFVGLVSCLVFSPSRLRQTRPPAEMREPATARRLLSTISQYRKLVADVVYHRREAEPFIDKAPPPLPNDAPEPRSVTEPSRRSCTMINRLPRTASSSPANSFRFRCRPSLQEMAQVPSVFQEPAVVQIEEPARGLSLHQPTEVSVYTQPAFVPPPFSPPPAPVVNRCRRTSRETLASKRIGARGGGSF